MSTPKLFSRKFFLSAGITLMMLVLLGISAFFLGTRFVGQILNEVINRETKGLYALNFESVDFEIFDKKVVLSELELRMDSAKDVSDLEQRTFYEIGIRELVIELESIVPIYLDRELVISNVKVVDPHIDMYRADGKKVESEFSFEAGNLYKVISDYLKVLKIDYFRIQDGALNYDEDQFMLGNINFQVKDLSMDSASRNNRVFYSETIDLEINNQQFNLPDSVHEVVFDKFILSTSDSVLSFQNLMVRPKAGTGVTFEGHNDINVYEIHVPELRLKGIDYIAAYQNNHLIVEELMLQHPTIFVDDETHRAEVRKDRDNSLLTLIFQVFGALDVGKLVIGNANVDIKIDKGNNYQRIRSEESNVVFYNIHLDTSNYRFDHRFKYFDDVEIDIHNYTYLLPDSVHSLNFELLSINSFDSEIVLENATISHQRSNKNPKTYINMLMPEFRLKYIDFQRASANKVLNAGILEVSDLYVGAISGRKEGEQQQVEVNDVYEVIKPFFREITIDQLNFQNAQLDLPGGLNFKDIDLQMTEIHLSAVTNRFVDLFQTATVSARGFNLDQDSVKVSGARLIAQNRMSSFLLTDWTVNVQKTNQQINGSFDSLQIQQIAFDQILRGDFTSFEKVYISNPNLEVELISSGNSSFDLGEEKEIVISNGSLNGKIDSMQFSMSGLDSDLFVGDSTAFRRLSVDDVSLRLPQINHALTMEEWLYDTLNGEMDFKNVVISPLNDQDSSKLMIEGRFELLSLQQFEQSEFFDRNHLFASELKLVQPDLTFTLPAQGEHQRIDTADAANPFTMLVQCLLVEDGAVEVIPADTRSLESVYADGITLNMDVFDYPSDSPFDRGNVGYAQSMNLFIEELQPYLSSGDQLGVNGFQFQSLGSVLTMQDSYYKAADERLSLEVPEVQIEGLDLPSLFEEQELRAKKVAISNPIGANYAVEKNDNGGAFVTPLFIDQIDVSNVNWNYRDTLQDRNLHIKEGYVSIESLASSDTLTLQNFSNRVKSLSARAGDLKIPLSDSYTLSLGAYRFNYPENNVQLNNIQLKSSLSAQTYSARLEKQQDWFDVSIRHADIKRIGLEDWISGKCYSVGKLELRGVDALIYRDKGVPFPEDQVRDLPQKTFRELKIPFQVDSIHFNGSIRYQEKPSNYYTHGELSIDALDAHITNVGNHALKADEVMKLTANGKLMNAGSFQVNAGFNMTADDERFTFKGIVKDFPLDSMNTLLGPIGNVNIKSGIAREVGFDFVANNRVARGEMRFRYDDLKVQFLNQKTHDTKGLGQGIKTFFANTFVVKNKNPSLVLFLRKGTIFHERDTSRAIFNYWGKALLSGAVSSIGVHKSDKAEKKFVRAVADE